MIDEAVFFSFSFFGRENSFITVPVFLTSVCLIKASVFLPLFTMLSDRFSEQQDEGRKTQQKTKDPALLSTVLEQHSSLSLND